MARMNSLMHKAVKSQGFSARWLTIGVLGIILGMTAALLKTEWGLIALSVAIALVSLVWMHYLVAVFSIRRLTVPAAFYWMYFLRVYLPAHVIFLEDRGLVGQRYMAAVLAVLVLVPSGMTMAQMAFRWDRRHTRSFFNNIVWPAVASPKAKSLWFAGLLTLSLVVMALHLSRLQTIPVIQLVRSPGQAAMIAALREASMKTLAVPLWMKYLMTWTRDLFLPLLTMLCWGEYHLSRKKKWLARSLVVLGIGLFYAALTLAKAPVAQFVLILVLFYWLWFDVKLSPKIIFIAVVLVFLFPFAVQFSKYGMRLDLSDVLAVVSDLWHRLFYITADVPYHYFDLFPIRGEFLGGRTIGLLSSVMGWEHFNTARYVYAVTVPGGVASGFANSAFIGDLYADFGMWGVLLGTFLTGFILQTLQVHLERQPKTTLLLAIYPFMCIAITGLVSTSITVTLMTGGVVIAVMILWCARHLGSVLQPRYLSHRRLSASSGLVGEPDMRKSR